MERYGKDPSIYHLDSIVDLVKLHLSGEKVFPEGVDIVTGGFPCQDFSIAGKRLGFNSITSHDGSRLPDEVASEENRGKLFGIECKSTGYSSIGIQISCILIAISRRADITKKLLLR